jgi:hypothetical protein
MKYFCIITLACLFSCSESNSIGAYDEIPLGDSIYALVGTEGRFISLEVATRIHQMKQNNIIDSNVIKRLTSVHKDFFWSQNSSFIGTYVGKCKYDRDYAVIDLKKSLKKEILDDLYAEHMKKKILHTKREVKSGGVSRNEILENFPNEIYIRIDDITTLSSDSIFSEN